jgi:hypothetical protein
LYFTKDYTRSHSARFHSQLGQDIAAEWGQFQSQDYWPVRKDGQKDVSVANAGCFAACLQSGIKINILM